MLFYGEILSSALPGKREKTAESNGNKASLCSMCTDLLDSSMLMVFLWRTAGDFFKDLVKVSIIRKSNNFCNFINL